jgi:uncharacterized protein (DUF952 family)
MSATILHITTRGAWDAARAAGRYEYGALNLDAVTDVTPLVAD